MKNIDNRVRYTKKVLQDALIKLLHKKSITEVTIKELCEEAHINRGTFYLHYSTPNDLLKEIEDNFITENFKNFSLYLNHPTNQTSVLTGVFVAMLTNKDLCKIIMGKNGSPKFQERIGKLQKPVILESWKKEFPNYNDEDLEYVYDFITAGSLKLISNWLNDDQGLSAEELGNRLDRLGHYCHLAITEFNKKPKKKKI